jgi:methylated-DNA-protein-cysteine methyltransferase-like protein
MARCWQFSGFQIQSASKNGDGLRRKGDLLKSPVFADIYAVVARIPAGKVATYGQVAKLAGLPGYARQVGYALSANSDKTLPWHRVVNAQGRISRRTDGGPGDMIQRLRLEEEGIELDGNGRISLKRFQWMAGG